MGWYSVWYHEILALFTAHPGERNAPHRIPNVMLTGGRHLTVCLSATTALFAAYLGKRSAIGEIVPSGHYDNEFR
jgi:hypothetical protein